MKVCVPTHTHLSPFLSEKKLTKYICINTCDEHILLCVVVVVCQRVESLPDHVALLEAQLLQLVWCIFLTLVPTSLEKEIFLVPFPPPFHH